MEQSVKLANVDIEDSPQYMSTPALWVRYGQGSKWAEKRRDIGHHAFLLPAGGSYDFMTYYGGLSLRKWNRYTNVHDYELHIVSQGKFKLTLEYADAFAYPKTLKTDEPMDFDDKAMTLHTISLEKFRDNMHGTVPVIVGFKIETDASNGTIFKSVSWWAHSDYVRDVSIAICTTTFKKEKYITANIEKIRNDILYAADGDYSQYEKDEAFDEVSRHFIMNVIDNGRTLDGDSLSSEHIRIIPNPNAGGAGGFARGMIESKDEGVTHALMMDDDVAFCTEAFIRTFNLLRVVKTEYEEAFVSGAMLSMYDVDMQQEDTGFMNYGGYCQAVKPPLRLTLMHEVVHNEAFEPVVYRPECHDIFQQYAAWWYCCIPMTQIDARGLPLPLFVRFDDVEYALRDRDDLSRKFITLNGICVWHEPFFMRYDAVVERYQITRNALIIRAASHAAIHSDFDTMIKNAFKLELKRLNYDDAELVCEGLEDFLAGPDVTFAPGFAERRFLETHKTREKAVPLDQLKEKLLDLGIDLDNLEPSDVFHDYARTRWERLIDVVTYLGHDIAGFNRLKRNNDDKSEQHDGKQEYSDDDWYYYSQTSKVAIMSRDIGAYQAGEIRNADVIVAIDVVNKTASIRHRDNDRFNALLKRFKQDWQEYSKRKNELEKAYSDAAKVMKTREAWEKYLKM